jgi:hypothetical protein
VAKALFHRDDRLGDRRQREWLGLVATEYERLDPNEREAPPTLLNRTPNFDLGSEWRHRQEREMRIMADAGLIIGQQGDHTEIGDRVEKAVEIASAEGSGASTDRIGDIEAA